MRASIVAIGLVLLAGESQAGTLSCSFTEPFFTITFDSQTGTVTWLSADVFDDAGKPVPQVVAQDARLRAVDPDGDGRTLRLESGERSILELRLTGQGSDGMSETIFPFEGRYAGYEGGCETAKYPAFDSYDILEDLGVSQ